MVKDQMVITIPRQDPVEPYTMAGIIRDAGLVPDRFRELF
jgi:hypothetical protein